MVLLSDPEVQSSVGYLTAYSGSTGWCTLLANDISRYAGIVKDIRNSSSAGYLPTYRRISKYRRKNFVARNADPSPQIKGYIIFERGTCL